MNYFFERFIAIASALDAQTVMAITAITAIVSIFIAVVALSFSICQGMQNRKHNRLSVYPYLILGTSRDRKDSEATVAVTLTNDGVGLAFIKEFVLYYNGKKVARNNAEDYKKFLCGDVIKAEGYKTTGTGCVGPDACIKVGEEKILWSAKYNPKEQDGSILTRLNFYIEYQSIYRKQDKTFIRDGRTRKTPYDKPIIKPL